MTEPVVKLFVIMKKMMWTDDSSSLSTTMDAASTSSSDNAASSTSMPLISASTSDGPGRKFPSIKDFAKAGGEKMKRKIAPIKHWTELKELELFRVKKVIGMNIVIKKEKRLSF